MTPLQIQIALHYYTLPSDFPDLDTPIVQKAVEGLTANVLLRSGSPNRFELTNRGRVFVDALQEMPLPVKRWHMPAN